MLRRSNGQASLRALSPRSSEVFRSYSKFLAAFEWSAQGRGWRCAFPSRNSESCDRPRGRKQGFALSPATAAEKKDFKVAWSIYVGWMPWGYAADTGIVKKWADKYGINIEVTQFNDYVESINQYTAGTFDAVTMTNMDTLSIPAAGGVDTTAVIVGDFSNGNDAVILKDKARARGHQGPERQPRRVLGVALPAWPARLESIGLTEKDLKVVNTSDADMAAAYKTADVTAVVTWKPIVSTILEDPDAHKVFDSSQIPGEIIDLMVVNTAVLKDNPKFAKALAGIWYETLATMKDGTRFEGRRWRRLGHRPQGLRGAARDHEALLRLRRTPWRSPTSEDLKTTTERVSKFLFEKSLLGKDAKSDGAIGVEFPDKTVFGDKVNVKFRYDATYMKEAEDGKL